MFEARPVRRDFNLHHGLKDFGICSAIAFPGVCTRRECEIGCSFPSVAVFLDVHQFGKYPMSDL
jgi:hypothetical protein